MPDVALVIKFTAKYDHADAFGTILEAARQRAEASGGPSSWVAARSEETPNVFLLVYLFSSAHTRAAYMTSSAAALILGSGSELLALRPELSATTLLAHGSHEATNASV